MDRPITDENISVLGQGVTLADGTVCRPAIVKKCSDANKISMTITEGKYHEIKRMFGAVGNKITFLKRISFGTIKLDPNLSYGQFRPLTPEEKSIFE